MIESFRVFVRQECMGAVPTTRDVDAAYHEGKLSFNYDKIYYVFQGYLQFVRECGFNVALRRGTKAWKSNSGSAN